MSLELSDRSCLLEMRCSLLFFVLNFLPLVGRVVRCAKLNLVTLARNLVALALADLLLIDSLDLGGRIGLRLLSLLFFDKIFTFRIT